MNLALIYAGSFFTAAIVTVLTTPLWRRLFIRLGLVDDPGERKIHSTSVPLAGGVAVFTALFWCLLLAAALAESHLLPPQIQSQLAYGFARRGGELGVLFLGGVAMLILGILDDRWEPRPLWKFAGQFLIALFVALAGIRITLFVPSLLFSYFITVLWVITIVNAFNFMDNMNGLCGGLSAIAAFLFGISAATRGEFLVAAFAFLCCGAFCGFLPYNFPRAKVFLGDSGSHFAGFVVGVLAILPHYYSAKYPRPFSVLAPLLVLAVPLVDLATVVLIRWRAGKPFYIGDTNHLSHRLVRRGLTPARAVMLIWAAALAIGAVSLLL